MKERNTKQKALILSAVRGTVTHPTAEQVYYMLADSLPNLSLGTVYRNLSRLAEAGIITRISVNNSPDRFDGNVMPHHHICCTRCGNFVDFFDSEYDKEQDIRTAQKSGYEIIRHETVFYGLCPECKQKNY